MELVQLAKHRKGFPLATRDVARSQCTPVVLKDSRSCCPNSAKKSMWHKYMAWVRDDSKYRQETILYYSRLYYTVFSLNRTTLIQ